MKIPIHPEEDLSKTPEKLSAIREVLRAEYAEQHDDAWIIAYSGGKDSTLLLQLVFTAVLSLPPAERRRQVHIVANDTQVESPLVINHLRESMAVIGKAIAKHNLPFSAKITEPCVDDTFWVNVIGRGCIPPTRNFRWCTDRLKIRPTTRYIKNLTHTHSRTILLVGTRKAESASRKRRMEAYGAEMNPHNQIKNCRVFSPLAELTDNEVWSILLQSRPPWGGTHRNLITLNENGQMNTAWRAIEEFFAKPEHSSPPTKKNLLTFGKIRPINEIWRFDEVAYKCRQALTNIVGACAAAKP